ncbi:hypothetical protein [Nocardioides ungokensis]|uniref:hypothetical protein n=1 Tax=Nocardioides ungokensis TaxID=1643322 RepID=UPI0015DDF0B3|nr:hypothetical protein [Nocardioides ungokensis]
MHDSDRDLPRWGAGARRAFKTGFWVYVALWLFVLALDLFDAVFDTHLRPDDVPPWIVLILGGLLVAWLLCGIAWLVGAAVAGYRDNPLQ